MTNQAVPKPCPFCGSQNVSAMEDWVTCNNCMACGPACVYASDEPVLNWNRRADALAGAPVKDIRVHTKALSAVVSLMFTNDPRLGEAALRELNAIERGEVWSAPGAGETPLRGDDVRLAVVSTRAALACAMYEWQRIADALNARLSALKASARSATTSDVLKIVEDEMESCWEAARTADATGEAAFEARAMAGHSTAERILSRIRCLPAAHARPAIDVEACVDEIRLRFLECEADEIVPIIRKHLPSGGAAVVPSEIGFEKVLVDSAVTRADAEDEADELRAALVTLRPKVEKFCPSGLPLIDRMLGLNPAPEQTHGR